MQAMLPSAIRLNSQSNCLELEYSKSGCHSLPAEYLRVFSPSAEVRGHGQGQSVLQSGKAWVRLQGIESVGNYALKLCFDDGHHSGLYHFDYLYQLALSHSQRWPAYLDALLEAGLSREPEHPDPNQKHGTKNG